MSATLSISQRYAEVYEDVQDSLNKSQKKDTSWVTKTPLRQLAYEKKFVSAENLLFFKKVWESCIDTAILCMTQIAPPASLEGKEDAIILTTHALFFRDNQISYELYPEILKTFEMFETIFKTPLKASKGQAILCNCYDSHHQFVIERRGNDCCILFQSYLNSEGRGYSFSQYLQDETKHIEWTPQNLIHSIQTLISKDSQILDRMEQYQRLFSVTFNHLEEAIETFDFLDKRTPCPILSIASNPYSLALAPTMQ